MWIHIFVYFDVFFEFIRTTERYPDVFIETIELFCVERNEGMRIFRKERERLDHKLLWLSDKKEAQTITRIKPILYKYDTSMCAGPMFVHKDTLYVNNPSLTLSPSTLISIHPSSFTSHRSSSLTTVRDGWFLNLSSVSIPLDIVFSTTRW